MNVQPVVGTVAEGRFSRMHPHSHAHLDPAGPFVRGERELSLEGGGGRLACVLEDDKELVAAMIDDVPACLRNRIAQQATVVVEQLGVVVAELSHELRRALDIGENERELAMREFGHCSLLQRDLSTNTSPLTGRAVHVEPPAEGGYAIGEPTQTGAAGG